MACTNREIRRQQIMKVVVSLVAREGIDSLTVRRVAAEIGYSTTVVTHYFSSKADLVHSFGTILAEHERNELKKYREGEPVDLIGYLISKTDITDFNIAWWRYFFVMWSRTLREPHVAELMNEWCHESLRQLGDLITAVYPNCQNGIDTARRLWTLTEGISIRRHIDPENWTADEVRKVLESEIKLLVGE